MSCFWCRRDSIRRQANHWFGSGTIELIEDFDGDTFRAVYTVRFSKAIYVLHTFKKKSKQGSKTLQSDIDLIKRRLRATEADYALRFKESKS